MTPYKEKVSELKRLDRETYDLFLEDLMSIVYGDGGDCPDVDDVIGQSLPIGKLIEAIQERRKWEWSLHGGDPTMYLNSAQMTTGYYDKWVGGEKRKFPETRGGDGHSPASALLDAYLATLSAGLR